MKVLKFGGTSMGDEHTWHRVLHILENYDRPVVIVSATARTTRQLVAAAELALTDYEQTLSISTEIRQRHRLLVSNFMNNYDKEAAEEATQKCYEWIDRYLGELQKQLRAVADEHQLTAKRKDRIAATGELLSSRLFAICGSVFGFNTVWVDAGQVVKTDSDFGRANPDFKQIETTVKQISKLSENEKIPVMGGYYGSDSEGNTTTLGFEGSDFTASLVGAALNTGAIEIWTDVSGIFTCDPRVVEQAKPIEQLSFEEATELAYFGAKVLHPSTMKPAAEKNIPVFVKNIFEPEHPGTIITSEAPSRQTVKAMTFLENITIITVTSGDGLMGYQFLSEVFQVLNNFHASVDAVTTTEASVSVALEHHPKLQEMLKKLEPLGSLELTEKQGLISMIGCRFQKIDDITKQILKAVPDTQLSMLSFSKAKRNLNLVVPEETLIDSVKAIHNSIF